MTMRVCHIGYGLHRCGMCHRALERSQSAVTAHGYNCPSSWGNGFYLKAPMEACRRCQSRDGSPKGTDEVAVLGAPAVHAPPRQIGDCPTGRRWPKATRAGSSEATGRPLAEWQAEAELHPTRHGSSGSCCCRRHEGDQRGLTTIRL